MQGWKYFLVMLWVLQYRARVSDSFFWGVILNRSKIICPNDQLLTNLAPCAFFRTQVGGSQFSLRSLEKIPSEMEVAPRNNLTITR